MLRTSRLLLRRFAPGDEEAMFRNWTSDPAVSKFMRWTAHQSPAEDRELLENILSQYSLSLIHIFHIKPACSRKLTEDWRLRAVPILS